LGKGQQAILFALAYPKRNPGKRTDLTSTDSVEVPVHTTTLSQARAIVRWAPEYVPDIKAGARIITGGRTTPAALAAVGVSGAVRVVQPFPPAGVPRNLLGKQSLTRIS
jgi:hypothetical protein